jgi:hypothetical protein
MVESFDRVLVSMLRAKLLDFLLYRRSRKQETQGLRANIIYPDRAGAFSAIIRPSAMELTAVSETGATDCTSGKVH